jgi:hypothetical protein
MTIYVTVARTLTAPDGTTTDASQTFPLNSPGYESLDHLRREARTRWHRPSDGITVVSLPNGIRKEFAKPRTVTSDGWILTTTAETLTVS